MLPPTKGQHIHEICNRNEHAQAQERIIDKQPVHENSLSFILSLSFLLIEHAYHTMYACLFATSAPPDDDEGDGASKQHSHTAQGANSIQVRPIDHCPFSYLFQFLE